MDEAIPVAAADRWARAQALRAIRLFDSSAETGGGAEERLPLSATSTSSPRFSAWKPRRRLSIKATTGPAWAYARIIIVPNFDSRERSVMFRSPRGRRSFSFSASVRSLLAPRGLPKNDFDPMFAAGLIRQESTFFRRTPFRTPNAIGLMQVLPKGLGEASGEGSSKVRYTKNKLF